MIFYFTLNDVMTQDLISLTAVILRKALRELAPKRTLLILLTSQPSRFNYKLDLNPGPSETKVRVSHLVDVEPVRQVSDDLGRGVALFGVPEQVFVEVGHVSRF